MKLNLTPQNRQEELIFDYLQNNASETLIEKINNGTPFTKDGKPLLNKKSLAGFMKYALEEAKKLAEKGATGTYVDDLVVYGWAIHYFVEDSIEGTLYTIDGSEYKPSIKTSTKPTYKYSDNKPKKESNQITFFDLMDEQKPTEEENEEPTKEEIQEAEKIAYEYEKKGEISPIYVKYQELENMYPDSVIIYKLGDFYEIFGENALFVGNELELTVTSRDFGLSERIAMIGFPYHAFEKYCDKIIEFAPVVIYDNGQITIKDKDIDYEEMTEEEMQKFDGDMDESVVVNEEYGNFEIDSDLASKICKLLDMKVIAVWGEIWK